MSQPMRLLRPKQPCSSMQNQPITPVRKQRSKVSSSASPEFRRPLSRTGIRPQSPRLNCPPRQLLSIDVCGSRPGTPSSIKMAEPYTGTIRVSIRPNPSGVDLSQICPWSIDGNENKISNVNDASSFVFDNVFPASHDVSNRQVYQSVCSEIVHKFLHQSYNGTVFAYGMTGLGKTFSMKGVDSDPGFVSLAIDDIFDMIDLSPLNHSLVVNYLEIYNEKIVDLLSTSAVDLKIRDDLQYGTKILGITSPIISSKQQLLQLIKKGDLNRKTSVTDFNARSSRSHAIIQLKLTLFDTQRLAEKFSTLSLCDLAGSERATSSMERRMEGSFINKSLLALSNVINKLSVAGTSASTSNDHIPYRNSKLTRFLQPALSGSSLISILCTIDIGADSTNSHCVSETYSTLRFAARAKDVVMNVQTNRYDTCSEEYLQRIIQELRQVIERQRSKLELSRGAEISNSSHSDDMEVAHLCAEVKVLQKRISHLSRLCDLQKTETSILKNDALNDIVGLGVDSSQIMLLNLEDFCRRTDYEVQEHKLYARQLENLLNSRFQAEELEKRIIARKSIPVEDESDYRMIVRAKEAIIQEQAEMIEGLQELIIDKDHIIHSLSKASELRRLVESNSGNKIQRQGSCNRLEKDIATLKTNSAAIYSNDDEEKENRANLKPFKISHTSGMQALGQRSANTSNIY